MNRSRFEIIAGIMQNCLLPRGKTHIMYKGNLSFKQTNAYLSLLTSLRLLLQTDSKYETTDKGRQFLSVYNQLGRIIGMPAPTLTKTQFVRGMKVEEKLGNNSLIIQAKPDEKRSRKRSNHRDP